MSAFTAINSPYTLVTGLHREVYDRRVDGVVMGCEDGAIAPLHSAANFTRRTCPFLPRDAVLARYLLSQSVRDGWFGVRVVSVLDSGAEEPGFKSQPRRCRLTVLGKLFTPIVHLFTKQRNS